MRQSRLQREIGDTQHEQNEEGADPHRPGEPDFGNQLGDHDREDDSAQTGSSGCYAEGESTTLSEPGADGVDGGVEDGACADWTADSLSQDELVVLC